MVFDKEIYTKRFINESSIKLDKQIESTVLEYKIDEFEAAGGKIEIIPFGVSNSKFKDLKTQRNEGVDRMKANEQV